MPAVTASAIASPAPASLKATVVPPVEGQMDVSALFVADKAARDSAAKQLAALAQKDGPSALQSVAFGDALVKALTDKKSPAAREGAAEAVSALVNNGAVKALEPIFVNSGIYAALLEAFRTRCPPSRTLLPRLCGSMSPT
jgi:elongation factor 3